MICPKCKRELPEPPETATIVKCPCGYFIALDPYREN